MPLTTRRATLAVARLTWRECLGSPGMRLTLGLLLAAAVSLVASSPWWATGGLAPLAAALAAPAFLLVVLMSFSTGPLSRDLANGTATSLVVSAVDGRQIVTGTALALSSLAVALGLATAAGVLAVLGTWAALPLAAWLTVVVLGPLVAYALATLTAALAYWRGTDVAMVAPWATTLLLGAALGLLALLAGMDPLGWGPAALLAVTASCLALGTLAALQPAARTVQAA